MEQQKSFGTLNKSLAWTAGTFILTAFHHYYGSVVYGTPWRAHVVFLGGITLLVCLLLSWLYRRYQKRFLFISYAVIAFIMFGVLIGLFEGLYNHVMKNLFYFSGMNINTWRSLFPAPAYELPDNIVFEASGILQFPVGALQGYWLYKAYKIYKR